MSSSKDTAIYTTALAAFVAGGALAYTYTNYKSSSSSSSSSSSTSKSNSPVRPIRKSLISEQNNSSLTKAGSTSDILFPHNYEEKMRRRIATRVSVEEENSTPRTSVTVRVPATSANVGPGCE